MMKPFLLLIAPVRADPDFARKIAIVQTRCATQRLDCRLPLLNPPSFNLETVLSDIRQATHIVADLSYARPSCYYELGLVEASARRASLVAMKGTEIFQHAGHGSVSFFENLDRYSALIGGVLSGTSE